MIRNLQLFHLLDSLDKVDVFGLKLNKLASKFKDNDYTPVRSTALFDGLAPNDIEDYDVDDGFPVSLYKGKPNIYATVEAKKNSVWLVFEITVDAADNVSMKDAEAAEYEAEQINSYIVDNVVSSLIRSVRAVREASNLDFADSINATFDLDARGAVFTLSLGLSNTK